jgi:two-component system NtrC family sensor kinase
MLTNQKLFRGVEVVSELDPAEPKVVMDRDHLTQILINLLVNAAQALAGKGTITLSTQASGREAILRVADDGPGIPAEEADRIFDPFFTTKPVGQGTGLGLSICHRIVEGEGGLIRLKGPGPGAVFEVVLPAAFTESEAEAS